MRVLVTGGAGFIGGNLVRALASRGDEVLVFDNLATCSPGKVALDSLRGLDVEFHHGDVRCEEDLQRLGRRGFDRVYHLASSFANELSVHHPLFDTRCNVDGTRHVAAFARSVGCGLFVYTGSSSSYGDAPVPTDESAAIRPQTPYARSKYEGELLVRDLPHAILRLFNCYGPGDPPGRWRNAIPNMMRDLDAGELRIFGRDATRDFTFVGDVVRVLVDADHAQGEIVNVGTGVETRVVELAHTLVAMFGLAEERIIIGAPRSWDGVVRRCSSTEKLERLFGYRPATPLSEGLRETARWLHEAGHIRRRLP
jgi:nucleoside-diphosphate-sugar epimerase